MGEDPSVAGPECVSRYVAMRSMSKRVESSDGRVTCAVEPFSDGAAETCELVEGRVIEKGRWKGVCPASRSRASSVARAPGASLERC